MSFGPAAADPDATATLKLVVAYDGTDFHGFASQPQTRTVAGALEDALARVLRGPVHVACAGRTDAGVHAWGQVVSVPVEPGVDTERVRRSVNSQLAPEVVVREATLVCGPFDARHDARSRTYRYTIWNRDAPDPFLARYAWWVPEPLDLARLRLATDPFLGEHDFASFCRQGPAGTTTMRRVLDASWSDPGSSVVTFEIRATAFCWQMVRSIVGTLVDAGLGRVRPGDILQILRARDRSAAGRLAPPHGLCLRSVEY